MPRIENRVEAQQPEPEKRWTQLRVRPWLLDLMVNMPQCSERVCMHRHLQTHLPTTITSCVTSDEYYGVRSSVYRSSCHLGFAFLIYSQTRLRLASVKMNQQGCRLCMPATFHSVVMIWIMGWTRQGSKLSAKGANLAFTSF